MTNQMRLTPLEQRLLECVNHCRVDTTHNFAAMAKCRIASANNALYRLYRLGLIGIEEKSVRGCKGTPTVWSSKTNW